MPDASKELPPANDKDEKIPQLFRYFGSKARMSSAIAALVPPDTSVLVSLFMGSGVFEYNYAKNNPDCQVICFDIDPAVVNYHKKAMKNRKKLQEAILSLHDSLCESDSMNKEEYGKLLNEHRESSRQTGFDGAARFYILTAYSFSGKFGSFAAKAFRPPRLSHELPKNLTIHRGDALAFLSSSGANFNMSKTCIYLDPPYFYPSQPNYYSKNMFDHEKLSSLLKTCEYRWILSYNDDTRVRKLYTGKPTMSLSIVYTYYSRDSTAISHANTSRKSELVIFNTKPTNQQRNKSRKLFILDQTKRFGSHLDPSSITNA